ncbi:MAG TPA: SMI1/KNR4 family protein [Ruminiclostridium sp.]|nr:SMI1/KNR4 family protein [Ruminiclostridium sp.]
MNKKLEQTVLILKRWESKSKNLLPNGTLQVCHVPHIGCNAWLHELYVGLSDEQINELQDCIPVDLPVPYKEFLSSYNGLNIFSDSLSICGLRSLNIRTGDEAIQPYSLIDSNNGRPKKAPDTWLYFGSYSWDGSMVIIDLENGSNHNKIYRCSREDTKILNEWPDFWSWLLSETQRLSMMFDQNGVELDENAPTIPE